MPARYDLSDPGNQRKLDAADALAQLADEAGLTLIQLALAFVINHPAVTAAIIGPRTMEQLESQLGADEVVLDAAILDRIDEIVPPGHDARRRRRRVPEPGPEAGGAAARRRAAWSQLSGPAGRRRSTIASATASASTT